MSSLDLVEFYILGSSLSLFFILIFTGTLNNSFIHILSISFMRCSFQMMTIGLTVTMMTIGLTVTYSSLKFYWTIHSYHVRKTGHE